MEGVQPLLLSLRHLGKLDPSKGWLGCLTAAYRYEFPLFPSFLRDLNIKEEIYEVDFAGFLRGRSVVLEGGVDCDVEMVEATDLIG